MKMFTLYTTLFLIICCVAASENDHTNFLLWYMIPKQVHKEVLSFYYTPLTPNPTPKDKVILAPDRFSVYEPEHFLHQVEEDQDWINLSAVYLQNFREHSLTTQLNLLLEILKNASPSSIEKIFHECLHASTLLKKILLNNAEELIDFILNAKTLAEEIIEIFRIMERYSDFDLAADVNYLQKVREIAFERDDCELLLFTNAYPDIIDPINTCQRDLLTSLRSDGIPKVWNLVCANPHKSARVQMKESDCFIKFKLFSEPVNTNQWTLDMFAVACQEYKTALELSLRIKQKQVVGKRKGLTHIIDMIPLIPDPLYRQEFIKKYKFKDLNRLREFEQQVNGDTCVVKVVPFLEQCDEIVDYKPPARIANTRSLVSSILKHN